VGDTTLYKSVDSAATCESAPLTLPTINAGTDNRYTLIRCSSDGIVVVVASKEVVTAPTKNIQVSLDGGETWEQHTLGFYIGSIIWNISCSNDGSVIAVGMTRGELYTSTDGGLTFDYEYIPNLALLPPTLTSVSHAFKDASKLLVYSSGRIHTATIAEVVPEPSPTPPRFTTTPKTLAWDVILDPLQFTGKVIGSACGNLDGSVLYFAEAGELGALKSVDGGATFTTLTVSEEPGAPAVNIKCSQDGTKVILYFDRNFSQFVYTSTNSGISWIATIIPENVASATVTPDGSQFIVLYGLNRFVSSDGITWTTMSPSLPSSGLLAASDTGTTLYVFGLGTTLLISTNSGASWVSFQLSISASPFSENPTPDTLLDCSLDGSVIIVGSSATTNNVQVLRYGGRESNTFSLGTTGIYGVCCSNSGNVLLAVTLSREIYVSDNRGQTFTLQTVPELARYGSIPVAFLAKDESNALVYDEPDIFTTTLT
jgi:hypothetical protein